MAVLALGLGGATAAFSALYAVVLRPLPYPQPERLVAVHSQFPQLQMTRLGVSPPDYRDLKEFHRLFSNAGVFYYLDLSRSGMQRAQKVNAVAATASLFQTLGVRPQIGRYFIPAEEQPGGPHVVLLSENYWRSAFGHDPHILSKSLRLNGEWHRVIGVMPASFDFPNDVTQMWVPVALKPHLWSAASRQSVFLRMYARLAPGIPLADASKQLDRISAEAAARNRGGYTIDITGWKYFLVPLAKENNQSLQSWTWIFFGAVAVLFVIVCVNAGGLLLLRATERAFDTAVRLALGAGRARIVRHALAEACFVCTAGAVGGSIVAWVAMHLLSRSGEFGKLPFVLPVFAFGIALTLLTMAFCSLYPIWAAMRSNPVEALNAGGHQRTGSKRKQYFRRVLVVVQVSASTVLLAAGSLLLHTYIDLLRTPLGFDPENVTTMQISLPPLRYASEASRRTFYETALTRVRHIPGVVGASACTLLPFGYGENIQPFEVAGRPEQHGQTLADVNNVLPGFFSTLKIPLLAGGYIDEGDRPGSQPAVIVDDRLARQYFPNQNAVGQQILMEKGHAFTIAGVVGDIKVAGLDEPGRPTLYFSALQLPVTDLSLVIKTSRTLTSLPENVQSIVASIDSDQPVYDVAPLQKWIDHSVAARRFVAILLSLFAAIGTAVTAIGLYGLLSYAVVLRQREFGIRAAVGARPRDLALLVWRSGLGLVFVGGLAGSLVTLMGARYLSGLLYGVEMSDPVTWCAIVGVLAAAALLSSIAPSWRASRTNGPWLLKDY